MNWDELDALFNRFTSTVFRLEALQDYTPEEADRVAAFLRGSPRPERSVRTSPWLARIAVSTATEGKRWGRVRVVEEPLTTYTRYELLSYVESQAAGEEIRIARRTPDRRLRALRRDFWLFDAGLPKACALLLHYSGTGKCEDAEVVLNPRVLAELMAERDLALAHSVPLNEYLAGKAAKAA